MSRPRRTAARMGITDAMLAGATVKAIRPPAPAPADGEAPGVYAIHISGWHPPKLNTFGDGQHWAVRRRAKQATRDVLGWHASRVGVPAAAGRRRLGLTIVLGKGQRAGDPDAYWKALNDALVKLKLLVDDNRQGVELVPVEFARGPEMATIITLTDLEG